MNHKHLRTLSLIGAVLLSLLPAASIIFASIFTFQAPLTVFETAGTSYTQLPITVPQNNTQMVSQGWMSASGLDVAITSAGGSPLPGMIASDRTMTVSNVAGNTSTYLYETVGNSPAASSMPVIVGNGGSISTPDNAALELGNNFSIEMDGYYDTSSGASKYAVNKAGAIATDSGSTTPGSITTTTTSGYPTFVAMGAIATAGSGDVTPALPTGWVAGDIFICTIASLDNVSSTMPAGWTTLQSGTNSGASLRGTTFWRRAVGGDTDPLVTHTAGSTINAAISAYRNSVLAGNFQELTNSKANGVSTTLTFNNAGTTAGIDNSLIILNGELGSSTTSSAYSSSPTPTTRTSGSSLLAVADFPLSVAGLTATRTCTIGASTVSVGGLYVMLPYNQQPVSTVATAQSSAELAVKTYAANNGTLKIDVGGINVASTAFTTPSIGQGVRVNSDGLFGAADTRLAQRINSFPITTISSVKFWSTTGGSPPGNITVNLRKVSDDSVVGTFGTVVANTTGWHTVSTPVANPSVQDVRICVEYSGGDAGNVAFIAFNPADTVTGFLSTYNGASWSDTAGSDLAFAVYYTTNSSILDTANNYLLDQNNAMPDISLFTITVGGVEKLRYQHTAIITSTVSATNPVGGALSFVPPTTFADQTAAANSGTANDMNLLPASPVVNDAYYFGSPSQFSTLTLNIGTAGAGTWTIIWEYLNNGGTWVPLIGVTDNTTALTVAGSNTVSWITPADWVTQTYASVGPEYWMRARLSAFTSKATSPLGTQAWVTNALTAVLPDIDATQNGTITWGVNPVLVFPLLSSFVSSSTTAATPVPSQTASNLPQVHPQNWFTNVNLTKLAANPARPMVTFFVDLSNMGGLAAGVTESQVWIILAAFVTLVLMVGAGLIFHHTFIVGFIGILCLSFFNYSVVGILPWVAVVLFSPVCVLLILLDKTVQI